MAHTTTVAQPGDKLLPGDRLDEIDTTLYHLRYICGLIEAVANAAPSGACTDPVDIETISVVFGWIGDELHDVRLGLEEINKALMGA